tara:strand:- start:720 stop:1334 length:615 start_codon:yes stop_codon:yes gene_type:complete
MGRKSVLKKRYSDKEIKQKYVIKLLVYFQENGIQRFSMSKLASDFRISKTTLYNHFDSKKEMIELALDYKLEMIGEYQSVLENITLSYTERYRKAMLFFCVQSYDISSNLLSEIKQYYPNLWVKVIAFQKNVFKNLQSYYQIGIDIQIFKAKANPVLLSLNDQLFFEYLSNQNANEKKQLDVIEIFTHHCLMRFNGILSIKANN